MRPAMAIALPQADIERTGVAHMGRLLSGLTPRTQDQDPRSGPARVVPLSGGSIRAR